MPPPRRRSRFSGRGRVVLVVLAVLLFVLFTSARGLAGFYTDFLWYDSVGRGDVWGGRLQAQLVLAGMFSALFAVILWVNLSVAERIAPSFRPVGPDDELLRKYQDVMTRRGGLVRGLVAVGCGLLAGVSMSAQWEPWLLFLNGSDVGQTDPQFGMDVGFYLFTLPFLSMAVSWLFASLVIILFITAIAHYLNGGIRLQSPIERVTPKVKAHLSVLIGMLALTRAGGYWLDRYDLVYSERGAVTGALHTDVNAQLPAIYLLLFIALLSFVLFVINIRRRGWVLPVVAVGLWAFVAIVVGVAYPAFIQRFQVQPAQSDMEAPYVERNIEATRFAMGMSDEHVETRRYEGFSEQPDAGEEAVQANTATIRNVPLLDTDAMLQTFQRLQPGFGFYRFLGLNVDRYPLEDPDGDVSLTQTLVSTRELATDEIQDSWENQHIVYTHGYGMALAPSNVTTAGGQPDFLVRNLPAEVDDSMLDLELEQPELYVGEGFEGYAIVGASRDEVSFLEEDGSAREVRYDGEDGVEMGSFLRRAAFALRFADWNTMVSGFVTDESKMIFHRDVRERVEHVAPFLSVDSQTYPVIADGRIYYVVDAYTTSNRWPYGQRAPTGALEDSGLQHDFNYVRNSVKAVVDAYDGTVTLYVMDQDDPIVKAWQSAFPDLFTDADQMSDDLRAHIRYPQDLFKIQSTMYARYHLDEPREFLEQTNAWSVAPAPPRTLEQQTQTQAQAQAQAAEEGEPVAEVAAEVGAGERMEPYYQIMRLPGESEESFVQVRSYTPRSRDDTSQRLAAFMAAKSDPDNDYGKLVVYEMPSQLQVNGPQIVSSRILANDEIAQQLNLLDSRGSTVSFGDLMLLPLETGEGESTIMYVWPVYVASAQTNVPELRHVVGVFGEQVVMEETLREVIQEMFDVDITTFEGVAEEGDLTAAVDDGEAADTELDIDDEPTGDDTTTTTEPTTTTTEDDGDDADDGPMDDAALVAELLAIEELLEDAEQSLRNNGDLGEYQDKVGEAAQRLQSLQGRLEELAEEAGA